METYTLLALLTTILWFKLRKDNNEKYILRPAAGIFCLSYLVLPVLDKVGLEVPTTVVTIIVYVAIIYAAVPVVKLVNTFIGKITGSSALNKIIPL